MSPLNWRNTGREYGAAGDGVVDDTAAIIARWNRQKIAAEFIVQLNDQIEISDTLISGLYGQRLTFLNRVCFNYCVMPEVWTLYSQEKPRSQDALEVQGNFLTFNRCVFDIPLILPRETLDPRTNKIDWKGRWTLIDGPGVITGEIGPELFVDRRKLQELNVPSSNVLGIPETSIKPKHRASVLEVD